ncbi:MAG: hypothetical protein F4X99_01880 [Gammaproteobacteria bacterium]|nr:hypothetical protein [Gammaproteobacteria bacterium]
MPAQHDGASLIRFELHFSEDFPGSSGLRGALLAEAFRVTNGTVREAKRAPLGQNRVWSVGVRPDSYQDVTIELPATTDCGAGGAICAADGRLLSNSLSATVAGLPPLTGEFHGMPASHDGTRLIRFELRFSEDFSGTGGLREVLWVSAFRVTNGTLQEASRAISGQDRVWSIGVRPASYEDVTIDLPASDDCTAAGAVCAADGRPLSNSLSATVEGPPPLTAEFVGMPTAHDGRTLFRLEVRFSEDFPGSSGLRGALLAEAFRVTNGTVREATRAPAGQNQVWTIGVRPDTYEDVTIELPATTDCSAAEAVCAADGRPLSNSAQATVEGPPPLTAEFVGVPASHDGLTPFRFELRFSENFPEETGLPAALLSALRVTDATVQDVTRATAGESRVWTIGVLPDSYEDVTVALPATTDCAAAGAVCAEDGRPLSSSLSATVAGPPPLTAEFVGVPASHDGLSLLRFELRFSENFPETTDLPAALLAALQVTHGTVKEVTRATPGDSQSWTIGVRPDSYEDVTIELRRPPPAPRRGRCARRTAARFPTACRPPSRACRPSPRSSPMCPRTTTAKPCSASSCASAPTSRIRPACGTCCWTKPSA